MYESFTVFNCQNFNIMQVTTAKSPEPKPFLSSEKEALFLPLEMAAVHFDHTMYYYTGGNDLPGQWCDCICGYWFLRKYCFKYTNMRIKMISIGNSYLFKIILPKLVGNTLCKCHELHGGKCEALQKQ